MSRPWNNKKGSVGEKRQTWLSTGGYTTCPLHGYHNKWADVVIKNSPALYCRICMKVRKDKRNSKNPVKVRLDYARERANKFKREFNLDQDYIRFLLEKQDNRCALSDIPFEEQGKFSFSIDRIDSNKGYTKDNIQLVNQYINVMKSDMSQEMFLLMCKQVANNASN